MKKNLKLISMVLIIATMLGLIAMPVFAEEESFDDASETPSGILYEIVDGIMAVLAIIFAPIILLVGFIVGLLGLDAQAA